MMKSSCFILSVFTMFALVAPAYAGEVGVQVVFTAGEAATIRAYYQDRGAPRTGKKKCKKGLPPGIAKQALPTGLIDLLPPPPRGFERVELSGKVLLVEVATQVIHDVLEDVILGR